MNFHSRQLKMQPLYEYSVPETIRKMELSGDVSGLEYYKDLVYHARVDKEMYFAAFTALLHMEEMAETKHIATYDLESVKLKIHSAIDQTFKIEFNVSIIIYNFINDKKQFKISLILFTANSPRLAKSNQRLRWLHSKTFNWYQRSDFWTGAKM